MSIDWNPVLAVLIILAVVVFSVLQRHVSPKTRKRTFNTVIQADPRITEFRIVGLDEAWRSLTDRQKQIARLVAQGYSNGEIAAQLGIKENTVDAHLKKIYKDLDVHSRTKLAYRIRDFIN